MFCVSLWTLDLLLLGLINLCSVYSTSVAMITHANEILRSIDGHCAVTHQAQLDICMDALRDLSKSWLVAEHCFNIALPIVDGLRVGDDLLSTM